MQKSMFSIALEMVDEYVRARKSNGPLHGPHEALGVIREEYVEFEKAVFEFNPRKNRDTRPNQREELIQIGAMCIAAIREVCERDEPTEWKARTVLDAPTGEDLDRVCQQMNRQNVQIASDKKIAEVKATAEQLGWRTSDDHR